MSCRLRIEQNDVNIVVEFPFFLAGFIFPLVSQSCHQPRSYVPEPRWPEHLFPSDVSSPTRGLSKKFAF